MQIGVREVAGMLAVLLCVSCGQTSAPTEESAPPENALQGVWQMEEIETTDADGNRRTFQAQPGQLIFTDSHYSMVYVPGESPRAPSAKHWEPTDQELVDQHRSIIVNSGAYEVSGSRITVRPIIAKSPEFVGGHLTWEYELSGDLLSLRGLELISGGGVSGSVGSDTFKLRRVE